MHAVVELDSVEKAYEGRKVLQGMTLRVPSGSVFGLLGPNGSGKTTTVRIIAGNLRRDSGSVRVLGEDPHVVGRKIRRRVGIVSQDDGLDPELSVEENLDVFGRYYGLSRSERRMRVSELLEDAGLTGRATDRIDTLSGGMRRRLVLARAMLAKPDLLLLDEPTTALDPEARHVVWESIRGLVRDTGVTVLLTTHFMDEAEYLCDSIAFIRNGVCGQASSPADFIASCCPKDVVEISGARSVLDSVVLGLPPEIEFSRGGDRLKIFSQSGQELAAFLGSMDSTSGATITQRAANLEDAYLASVGKLSSL